MRRLLLLPFAALACGAAHAATAPTGLWRLEDNNAQIRISQCGKSLCGRLVEADKLKTHPGQKDKMNKDPALRGRPLRNLLVLYGFKGGPEKWTGGRIYDPDEGQTYKSELTLEGSDTLKVTGCVVKPLCKSRTLTRVQ